MKQSFKKKIIPFISIVLFAGLFIFYETNFNTLNEHGSYISKEEVSLYLHTFEKLPSNYITKKEALALGWKASEGNLWDVSEQKSIGGDQFNNREKRLPDNIYYEADIDYQGGQRGPKRLVYSIDGMIYYTEDHYETFELLYGDAS